MHCGIQSQEPEDTAIGIPGSAGAPIKRIQDHRGENARMKNLRKTELAALGSSMENAKGDPAKQADLMEQAVGSKRLRKN